MRIRAASQEEVAGSYLLEALVPEPIGFKAPRQKLETASDSAIRSGGLEGRGAEAARTGEAARVSEGLSGKSRRC